MPENLLPAVSSHNSKIRKDCLFVTRRGSGEDQIRDSS